MRAPPCRGQIDIYSASQTPFFSTISLSNRSGLSICASHCAQKERSSEQLAASICRRYAPKRTGIPTRRAENGNAPAGVESWRPLGIRGELLALSERTRPLGKVILAAASKAL